MSVTESYKTVTFSPEGQSARRARIDSLNAALLFLENPK